MIKLIDRKGKQILPKPGWHIANVSKMKTTKSGKIYITIKFMDKWE